MDTIYEKSVDEEENVTKLSMWMIANRLTSFEMICQIQDNAKAVLKSARQVYADDCAVVTERGTNVICYDAHDVNNKIMIRNMSFTQGMELIQGVFDFYQDWIADMKRNLAVYDYQKVVNLCWMVFHNPIVLLNGNSRVLAMSEQYSGEEMGQEWQYLKKYGYPSISNMKMSRKKNVLHDMEGSSIVTVADDQNYKTMSSPIRFRDKIYGRLVVLERDRKFNAGDMQLFNIVVNELRVPLAEQCDGEEQEVNADCLGNILEGKNTNSESLSYLLTYKGWKSNDYFKVYKIKILDKEGMMQARERIFLESLKRNISECSVLRRERVGELYAIQDTSIQTGNSVRETLLKLSVHNEFCFSESLDMQGIYNIYFLREQADYTMERKMGSLKPGDDSMFYQYAIDYLLTSGNLGKSFYAIHPEIMKLWVSKYKDKDDKFDTYLCYLQNGRSLKKTAEQLHLHRNTIVYRIGKINDLIHCDPEDLYTMDYIRLSIRVLALMEEKKILTMQDLKLQ